ncbi:MAG TPA: hypothetical protein VIK91_20560 [Nannocystis sp.]
MTAWSFLAPRARGIVADMDHRYHLPRSHAVAGVIDHPDPPPPPRLLLPPVLVAGASESGPRWAVTRLLAGQAEDDAPQFARRARRLAEAS